MVTVILVDALLCMDARNLSISTSASSNLAAASSGGCNLVATINDVIPANVLMYNLVATTSYTIIATISCKGTYMQLC